MAGAVLQILVFDLLASDDKDDLLGSNQSCFAECSTRAKQECRAENVIVSMALIFGSPV